MNAGTLMTEHQAELKLDPAPDAPGRARDFVADTCRRWKVPSFLETGLLIVSELVTNAVVHAGTALRVTLSLASGVLTVAVHDQAPGMPRIIPPEQRGLFGGRGLAMVADLADAWGVDAGRVGKTVWCRLVPDVKPGTGDRNAPLNPSLGI